MTHKMSDIDNESIVLFHSLPKGTCWGVIDMPICFTVHDNVYCCDECWDVLLDQGVDITNEGPVLRNLKPEAVLLRGVGHDGRISCPCGLCRWLREGQTECDACKVWNL